MTSYAAYCSQRSYWRHVRPIVAELRSRGYSVDSWTHNGAQPWGQPLVPAQITAEVVIVASGTDANRVKEIPRHPAVVYVEHGAGQTYQTDDERLGFGYPGGPGLDHVSLFVCPSERVADRWRRIYPRARTAVVGCPAIDWGQPGRPNWWKNPIVTFSAHWICGVCPETRPAIDHYWPAIPDLARSLAADGIELVGHAHPRYARRLSEDWKQHGIRYESDPDTVLRESSLLIHDSSSLMYEAAALDLPVLTLNAPWYRRDVHHGLRFWDHVPGLQVDRPEDLAFMVDLAIEDPEQAKILRREAALFTYSMTDGKAAHRAADAIESVKG